MMPWSWWSAAVGLFAVLWLQAMQRTREARQRSERLERLLDLERKFSSDQHESHVRSWDDLMKRQRDQARRADEATPARVVEEWGRRFLEPEDDGSRTVVPWNDAMGPKEDRFLDIKSGRMEWVRRLVTYSGWESATPPVPGSFRRARGVVNAAPEAQPGGSEP